jgi:hypothetical protein
MHQILKPKREGPPPWDPFDVCRRLLRDYPLKIADPAGSTGRMDRRYAKLFWVSIAEYPDPLQDILFIIAHARGFEAALAALDQAIRAQSSGPVRRRAPWMLQPEPKRVDVIRIRRAAS